MPSRGTDPSGTPAESRSEFLRAKFYHRAAVRLAAAAWRRMLRNTRFIAVTGSFGKTTVTRGLAAVLEPRGRLLASSNEFINGINQPLGVAESVLKVRPRHRIAVMEIGTNQPGILRRQAQVVRPDIVVVTNVGDAHPELLPSLEDVAREKGALVEGMRRSGIAILNADDPWVLGMARRAPGRVTTFGENPNAILRATDVEFRWPGRLRFQVHRGTESSEVCTQLTGRMWLTPVLAILAAALECGVGLEEAACAVAGIEPSTGRMQAVPLPSGAFLIRDDFNRATATLDVALDLLRDATCARRVLIINDMKDPTRDLPERMRYIGRRTAESADLALFAGPGADLARAAAIDAGMEPTRVVTADSFREAVAFIREQTQAGDVVLLRNGIGPHLARLYYASLGEIGCWLDRCPYEQLCDSCSQLGFVPESALKPTGGGFGASSFG